MKKYLFVLPLLILITTSCTERVDVELDSSLTRLVVDGTITTDTTTHYIQLSTTSGYYYNDPPPPLSGAGLEITDDLGNVENLTEMAPGKYATSPLFAAVIGRTYTLTIDLPNEIDGHKIYTASSTVTPIYPIDSIGLVFQDWGEKGFYEVTCYYQDPPSRDFYLFNIFKNGEMLTDSIRNQFVSEDSFYNGNYTNGIGVGFLDQSKERQVLHYGDTVTFQGCNISEAYYNFVVEVQTETGFQTPLFSGPPANVKGNISDGAIGFFAVYSVAYSSTIFRP
jgi:hypothetical protein